ncbi:MAG: hypothetical protein DRP42_01505 [Tenericutes bacterium]|nr:MAG: hypothetical protein DRP42_01505 [Mycoplasmatota bacterium]
MKICWATLEDVVLGERSKQLRKGHYTYVEITECARCGDSYLMNKYKPTKYCCISCGKHASDYSHSKEARRKISVANKGNTKMLGKRHTEETKLLLSKLTSSKVGPLAPAWRGGVSFEPYCLNWTKEYKDYIKERDGYRCLNPYCSKIDDLLTVHHIDYVKKDCNQGNLITVCRSCNSRANTARRWHTFWYRAILYRRYGYLYT